MSDIIQFQPRPKSEPKISSTYREGRQRVASIEVYNDGFINTDFQGDNYNVARYLVKAMTSIIGMAETAPSVEDRILSALTRALDDVIDIHAEDK